MHCIKVSLINNVTTINKLIYSSISSTAEQEGFIFTAPMVLWSGRRETACISFHGAQKTGRANVTVNIETKVHKDSAVTKRGLETGKYSKISF